MSEQAGADNEAELEVVTMPQSAYIVSVSVAGATWNFREVLDTSQLEQDWAGFGMIPESSHCCELLLCILLLGYCSWEWSRRK